MYFSGRGAPMAGIALIAYLVIIFFHPVISDAVSINSSTRGPRYVTVQWTVSAEAGRIEYFAVRYKAYQMQACPSSSLNTQYVNQPNVAGWKKTVTIGGLQPYTVYGIEIGAKYAESGVGQWVERNVTTYPSDPAPVRSLTITRGNNQLSFSWLGPLCGEMHGSFHCYNYTLIRRDNTQIVNSGSTEYRHVTRKTYLIDALRACTAYTFKVQVITGTGISRKRSGWEMAETQTPTKAPGVPRNIVVAQLSGSVSVATVTWDAPTDIPCEADGYYVTYELLYKDMCDRSSEMTEETRYVESQTRKNMIEGLLSNSVYTICVHGQNAGGNGEPACVNFTTGPKEPSEPPKRVKYTSVSYYSLTFTWEKPKCGDRNGPITDYDYILNAPLGNFSIHGNVRGDENSGIVSFNELIPATTYFFRVRANNYNFPGSYGKNLEVNTSIAVYHPPSNVKVTTFNETTAVVEWNTPLSSDYTTTVYRIEYLQSNHKETTSIVVSCEADTCRPAGVMKSTITGLTPATTHSIQVIAVYQYDEEASRTMIFRTLGEDGEGGFPIAAIIGIVVGTGFLFVIGMILCKFRYK